MPTVYQDKVTADGSASNKTVYCNRIPPGKVLEITTLTAGIYTTAMGDYNTAKYVNLGVDVNGQKHYVRGRDVGTGDTVIFADGIQYAKEHDRPFADFEATATTTTYEVVVNGLLYDASELGSRGRAEE